MKVVLSKEILYVGLQEGELFAKTYWNGGVDSCLEKEIEVNIISVITKNEDIEIQEFLVLENGETINLEEQEKIYNMFIYGENK